MSSSEEQILTVRHFEGSPIPNLNNISFAALDWQCLQVERNVLALPSPHNQNRYKWLLRQGYSKDQITEVMNKVIALRRLGVYPNGMQRFARQTHDWPMRPANVVDYFIANPDKGFYIQCSDKVARRGRLEKIIDPKKGRVRVKIYNSRYKDNCFFADLSRDTREVRV